MAEKTLRECEEYLCDVKKRLKEVLQEQEKALREWNAAFASENIENIKCECENTGQHYTFLLINEDTKLEVADMWKDELEADIDAFYQRLKSSIGMNKIVNKNWNSFPVYYEDIIVAKAMEIRQTLLLIRDGRVISLKDRIKNRD